MNKNDRICGYKRAKMFSMKAYWQISDLPEELQSELLERLAQAKEGTDLVDIDMALSKASKTTDEILAVIASARAAS